MMFDGNYRIPGVVIFSYSGKCVYLSVFALGCVAACIYCGIRYFKLHGKHPVMVAAEGIRVVAGATSALLFAWVLIDMISASEAGTFLSGLIVKYAVPAVFLPFLLFLLSGGNGIGNWFFLGCVWNHAAY